MPKRTWSMANGVPTSVSPPTSHPHDGASTMQPPAISRKVKACAACRKQKIRCMMDDRGPPCKRCTERGLSCVLNKSLQTLIDERSQWKLTVGVELAHLHSAMQEVLSKLSLPPLPPSQIPVDVQALSVDEEVHREDPGPSCDNSPRVSPKDDALSHVPIESLYQITRLRALRSDDVAAEDLRPSTADHAINDFITAGQLSIEDATRLLDLYVNHLDHFMYKIGGKYRDLETLRRTSPTLTACICTVAALHDPMSNHLYGVCSREFRRLMAASMFDRRIDRDHLRAMCIGSYWLSDISFNLSCNAIARAMEVRLSSSYHRLISDSIGANKEEAMDCLRLWYILYTCDHHLSILYGRPSIVREDFSIQGWETLLKHATAIVTEDDKRMVSQVALLSILSNIRDLFGLDTGEPIPRMFSTHLASFSRQIDQWMGYWSSELKRQHDFIGEFPTKGVVLHHHLAKLHLHSHVFRGLKGPLPSYFLDSAVAAVSAATSIVESLLTDIDLRNALVGIPHYIHTMIAFACVFLLKVAAQHSGEFIQDAVVLDLTAKLVQQFRSTAVGKWHLVHHMADGLEKMASRIGVEGTGAYTNMPLQNGSTEVDLYGNGINPLNAVMNGNDPLANSFTDLDVDFATAPFLHLNSGNLDTEYNGLGMF